MISYAKARTTVLAALAAVALAGVGCKSSSSSAPPSSFGVNITVDAKALSAGQLAKVTLGSLLVTGVEPRIKQFSVVPQISAGQLTFQYVPNVMAGTLTFEFDALDAVGSLYGSGTSSAVTLTAGTAVSATITLVAQPGTTKGIGITCKTNADCGSGFCTDGVCCQMACKDTCVSCARAPLVGLCTDYDAGSDPEAECAGSTMTIGAGGADGGADAGADAGAPPDGATNDAETIIPPDGGIIAKPSACGGMCNGKKACGAFAPAGTSCGTPFCNTRQDIASPICDGKGSCGIGLSTCVNGYACNQMATPSSATCHTNCNANSDCTTGYYCNGTTSMCAPTKVDGLTCATDAECLHGHCAGAAAGVAGVCCNTACAAPFTCNDSGSAGTCKCPGKACNAGVSCTLFYPDADGDGYGDKTATFANMTAVAACADSPPANFVADDTDCDDHDANVHPGQTTYFSTSSNGIGTFDYDCDGKLEKGVPEYPGASCGFCPTCSAGCGTGAASCSSSGARASLACPLEGGICLTEKQPVTEVEPTIAMSVIAAASTSVIQPPIIIRTACCGCNDYSGFTQAVGCGVAAPYSTCGTCSVVGGGVVGTTSVSMKQICR